MVLVGSKNAADSENVGLEVKEFLETNRPIIPITFLTFWKLARHWQLLLEFKIKRNELFNY